MHFSRKERNRCQQLPGKPIEFMCDNSRLPITFLTGILNFLCLCQNKTKTSGTNDASHSFQQEGHLFWLS